MHELNVAVEHSIRNYKSSLLFSYKLKESDFTESFYLPIDTKELQYRTYIDEEMAIELMYFLSDYVAKLKNAKYENQRGISAPVDTNPSRE